MGGIAYTSTKMRPIYLQKSPIYPQKSPISPRVESDHGRYRIYLHKSAPINSRKSPIFPQKSRIPGISRQFHCLWQLPRKLANTRRVKSWEVSHIPPQKCALYICKRALYTRKRALYTRKSALFLVSHGSCRQGANTRRVRSWEGSQEILQQRPVFPQKCPIYLPKSPIHPQKSPVHGT